MILSKFNFNPNEPRPQTSRTAKTVKPGFVGLKPDSPRLKPEGIFLAKTVKPSLKPDDFDRYLPLFRTFSKKFKFYNLLTPTLNFFTFFWKSIIRKAGFTVLAILQYSIKVLKEEKYCK
jgi:hypothetical protein